MAASVPSTTTYHLYTFYHSSCAMRLRIALNLKQIPVVSHYIDMQNDEHESETYRLINPSGSIPTLVVETSTDTMNGPPSRFTITQSVAILEYLEEAFPKQYPLLPPLSKPEDRARVREFMLIVTSDIFPPTNSKIAERVRKLSGSREATIEFVQHVMKEGFSVYEEMLKRYSTRKKYSVDDEVTLADVCLIPQVHQARLYGIDFSEWVLLGGIIERLDKLEAFEKADYKHQKDTPEEEKAKNEL